MEDKLMDIINQKRIELSEARAERENIKNDVELTPKQREIKLSQIDFRIQELFSAVTNLENRRIQEQRRKEYEENTRRIFEERDRIDREYIEKNIFYQHEWELINRFYREKMQIEQRQKLEIQEQAIHKSSTNLRPIHKNEWAIFNYKVKNQLEYLATNKDRKNKLKELFNIRF